MFVDSLPLTAFGEKNGKRAIILEEVKQVLKVLFEGATKRPECVQFFNNFFKKLQVKPNIERTMNLFRSNKKKDEDLTKDDILILKGMKEDGELVLHKRKEIIVDGVKTLTKLTEE
jgi:hypothetical protein